MTRIATRRDFLTKGLGLVGIGSVLPNFLVHTALAAPQTQGGDQRVLVLVELSGGHDGPSGLLRRPRTRAGDRLLCRRRSCEGRRTGWLRLRPS